VNNPKRRRLLQVLAHRELYALNVLGVREANELRLDTVQRALDSMPPRQQRSLRVQARHLADEIPKLGPDGALQILAAIGIAFDDASWPRQ